MVARNSLYVEIMDHDLVPPFIMREAGLEVDEQAKIHTPQPSKENHSVYCKKINLIIPLKIEGIFSVFETRQLNATEIAETGEYDIVFISPDTDSWNPNCETWGDQEDFMLDQDGDIIQYEVKKPVEIIEESEYFGTSSMEAIGVSKEKYESRIDTIISSAYKIIPEPGDVTDSHCVQDWLLVEYGIRAHVVATDARLDEKLLDCALSYRLEFSKIDMAIKSMTDNCGRCELLEANMEQAVTKTRAEIGSTTDGQPKGVTPELLSKIWTIPFKMAEETLQVTSQLNRHGKNTSLAIGYYVQIGRAS